MPLLLHAHAARPATAPARRRPARSAASIARRPLPPCAAAPGDGGGGGEPAVEAPPAEATKGFGAGKAKGSGSGTPPAFKVSKRGTVASRGGAPAAAQARAAYDALEARSGGNAQPPSSFTPPSSSSSGGPPIQEVSPVVNARMFRRMVTFAGIPIATGLIALPAAYYVKKVLGWDLPNWAVYAFQSIAWGGGLLGITYGIFSSSWDPNFEGSALGVTEAKANLGALVERGQRKRERGGE